MPEVNPERLEHLELESRRLRTMLRLWSLTTGDNTDEMIELVDEMIETGVSAASLHRYQAKRLRRKKRPPSDEPGG